MEERLHEGIVRHLARTVHALGDLQLFEPFAEGIGIVFNTAIGVEDQPRFRAALGHRMLSARKVNATFLCRPKAQPIMRREQRSITTAR